MGISKFISTIVEQVKLEEHPLAFTTSNLFKTQKLIDALKNTEVESPFILLNEISKKKNLSTSYQDKETGNNLVHQAVSSLDHPKFLEYLITLSSERLELGEALTAKNNDGKTPLDIAKERFSSIESVPGSRFADAESGTEITAMTSSFIDDLQKSVDGFTAKSEAMGLLIKAEGKIIENNKKRIDAVVHRRKHGKPKL